MMDVQIWAWGLWWYPRWECFFEQVPFKLKSGGVGKVKMEVATQSPPNFGVSHASWVRSTDLCIDHYARFSFSTLIT